MKFVFNRGSAPDPTSGAYSAPLDLLADVRGPTSKGGRRGRGERKREGNGRDRPHSQIPGSAPEKHFTQCPA